MKLLLYSLAIAIAAVAPTIARADVSFYVNIAPPVLPVYVQPPIPAYGYIWTPGYWLWSDEYDDYCWVPGTWVSPPYVGALWTPGYWAASGDRYGWHDGYWGTQIGFYGGVNYGYGYAGVGYQGGYWERGEFRYNRAVNSITTVNITNVYNSRVINTVSNSRVSYNGGFGGINLRPTASEQNAGRLQSNMAATAMQVQHQRAAVANPMQVASFNHGLPQVAATPAPGAFNAPNVVSANMPRGQPPQRSSYGGDAPYLHAVQMWPQAQHPSFQPQIAQPARPPDRYAPQVAAPAQHEVMRAQPMQIQQQIVRGAPQEYRYQQPILRSPPVEHPNPAPILRVQTSSSTQALQSPSHHERANEREYRER